MTVPKAIRFFLQYGRRQVLFLHKSIVRTLLYKNSIFIFLLLFIKWLFDYSDNYFAHFLHFKFRKHGMMLWLLYKYRTEHSENDCSSAITIHKIEIMELGV